MPDPGRVRPIPGSEHAHTRVRPLFANAAGLVDRAGAELAVDQRAADGDAMTHLAREEREALPLMQRHLAGDQWKAAQRAAAKEYGLSDLRFAVPWSARMTRTAWSIALSRKMAGWPIIRC